jgi:hypothetical protein
MFLVNQDALRRCAAITVEATLIISFALIKGRHLILGFLQLLWISFLRPSFFPRRISEMGLYPRAVPIRASTHLSMDHRVYPSLLSCAIKELDL